MAIDRETFHAALVERHGAARQAKFDAARVAVCGLGGLGSNVAIALARAGMGHLHLLDFDRVEPSNLNRQHYFPRHVGHPKVEALAEQLNELRPAPGVEAHRLWLEEGNIAPLLDKADFWLECLDNARLKATFASLALDRGKSVIAASGMGGFGGYAMERRVMKCSGGLLAVVGDFRSDVAEAPPLAPRVVQCAAMQADAALELILTQNIQPLL